MKASKPHVVFQQALKGDIKKLRANFELATPDERLTYLEYEDKNAPYGQTSILVAAVKSANPEVVRLLLEYAAAPKDSDQSRSVWNSWVNSAAKVVTIEDSAQAEAHKKGAFGVLMALLDHGMGKTDLVGKTSGPAHKAIYTYKNEPDLQMSALLRMKERGYSLDQRDDIGETPLGMALWTLSLPAARMLIEEGADLGNRTFGGKSISSFIFRTWSGSSLEIDKKKCIEEVHEALEMLHAAGYDFKSELESKETLADLWGMKPGGKTFEWGWSVLSSFMEGKKLDADTPQAPSQQTRSPRL